MNKSKKFIGAAVLLALMTACGNGSKFKYETVPNDPMQTRIYTLDNGLKVYLTVNKETPRIQTYIAVRVGGKNDPAETTGLAHYFEHLMFKGTDYRSCTLFRTSDVQGNREIRYYRLQQGKAYAGRNRTPV